MAKRLLEIVMSATDVIDCGAISQRYPWLFHPRQNCIVSPDSDGILCGLLMSHVLGWRVRGFYDGKALLCVHGVAPAQCVFLDMEIFRSTTRSVGQHMVVLGRTTLAQVEGGFASCAAINNIRGHFADVFRRKYPFATVHFLLVMLASRGRITLPIDAAAPLLFTDGTYHNLFNYTENSFDWLRYLGVDVAGNPLHDMLAGRSGSIHALMTQMMAFWRDRDALSGRAHERGDRIAMTRRGGDADIINVVHDPDGARLDDDARSRGERFIQLLADRTGWGYQPDAWPWRGLRVWKLEKRTEENLTVRRYREIVAAEPLSFAITAQKRLEFTLKPADDDELGFE